MFKKGSTFFRSCHELNMIYVIARPLNGQNPQDRVKTMFNSPVIFIFNTVMLVVKMYLTIM